MSTIGGGCIHGGIAHGGGMPGGYIPGGMPEGGAIGNIPGAMPGRGYMPGGTPSLVPLRESRESDLDFDVHSEYSEDDDEESLRRRRAFFASFCFALPLEPTVYRLQPELSLLLLRRALLERLRDLDFVLRSFCLLAAGFSFFLKEGPAPSLADLPLSAVLA